MAFGLCVCHTGLKKGFHTHRTPVNSWCLEADQNGQDDQNYQNDQKVKVLQKMEYDKNEMTLKSLEKIWNFAFDEI